MTANELLARVLDHLEMKIRCREKEQRVVEKALLDPEQSEEEYVKSGDAADAGRVE